MNLEKLHEPFLPSQVHWRVGAVKGDRGIALAYLDARDIMDRLDSVCGSENWQVEYPFVGCARIGLYVPQDTVDQVGNLVAKDFRWVWKSNGAGETKVEGEKGQYSDAFKRAAVLWGIGRYLYDLDAPWVSLENNKIAPSEFPALNAMLETMYRFKPGEKDSIYKQVKDCLDNGDEFGLREILHEYSSPEVKPKVWALFNSQDRAVIKSLLGD
jgi:hypothetical protein